MSLWAPAGKSSHRVHAVHWLSHLGLPGVFGIAMIDSSPVPLPVPGTTDLLVLWLVSHKGNPFLLASCAIAGAIVGGTLGWRLGKRGGEAALKKRVPARLLDPLHRWAKRNPFLAVFLPALLPPPVPLSPFVLGAGALGIPASRFLIAFGAARTIRYSFVAWLGATYGRHVIPLWEHSQERWAGAVLWTFAAVFAGGIILSVLKSRRRAKSRPRGQGARESAAD